MGDRVRWDRSEPSSDIKTKLTAWTDDWSISIEPEDYEGEYFRIQGRNLRRMTHEHVREAVECMINALRRKSAEHKSTGETGDV